MAKGKNKKFVNINDGTEEVAIAELVRHPKNPRKGDVGAIQTSIKSNGFYGTIIVQRGTNYVLAGNHRFMAAVEEGAETLPVTWVKCDEPTALRILAVDNRTSDIAGYDERVLFDLLDELKAAGELVGSGYDTTDVDALLESIEGLTTELDTVQPPDENAIPVVIDPVSKAGDLWLLGKHRLIVGDCRDFGTVEKLLDGATINVAVTSPPYAEQREYDESSGFKPIPPAEYCDWFEDVQANVRANLAPDGSFFVNIKAASKELDTELYVLDLVLRHVRDWGWHFATEFMWERNGIPSKPRRRFKNQFEPVYQFALGEWKFRPEAVRHASDNVPVSTQTEGRNADVAVNQGVPGASLFGAQPKKKRKNKNGYSGPMSDAQGTSASPGDFIVEGLAYPGNRLPTFSSSHEATGHSAAYPVDLAGFFVKAYSDEGDVIFDPFMGSGSTLLAAHKHNRIGYGTELSPKYADIICARFQRVTGIKPILDGVGEVDFNIE